MIHIFETFKPLNTLLAKHISYYYLDVADASDYRNTYTCYPHYNNTLSLYKNHVFNRQNGTNVIQFKPDAEPLQIFTPLREAPLKVVQIGPVHKIGIVFNPFGINQFLQSTFSANALLTSPALDFFNGALPAGLFEIFDMDILRERLDQMFLKIFTPSENGYIEKALELFHETGCEMGVDEIAELKLGISRKQLNRLFRQYIGTSARKYRSIVRFRQLMDCKIKQEKTVNYTVLSHQVRYTDQSHFIKACRQLTGLTPSQFFKDGRMMGREDIFWSFR